MDVVEKHIFSPKLGNDAAHTPDIYLVIVARPQDDLRSTIASRLYVGAESIMDEAGVSQVHYLNLHWRV